MNDDRRRPRGTLCAVNGCAGDGNSVFTPCCGRVVWAEKRANRPQEKGAALAPGKADFEPQDACECGSREFLVAGVCVDCRNNRGQVFDAEL